MGCTSSREAGHDASSSPTRSATPRSGTDSAQVRPSSSSQAIVDRGASPSRTAGPDQHSRATQTTTTTSPDGRPNRPLRAPSPVRSSPTQLTLSPWTRSELARQREAFFDTRVTGSNEVWAAVKLACDMLRTGDMAGAQNILDITGLTCPTGTVVSDRRRRTGRSGRAGGVYDDRGELYDVPGWIVADPQDLVEEDAEEHDEKLAAFDGVAEEGSLGDHDGHVGEIVQVKTRLSTGMSDVVVSVGMEQRVGVVLAKVKQETGMQRIKLMHMGKMLKESEKLSETSWMPGQVLSAFVFE